MSEVLRSPRDVDAVLRDLNARFLLNLDASLKEQSKLLSKVEVRARAIVELGQLLKQHAVTSKIHEEIVSIFSELFADVVCSIYLAACALDKPAQVILRRVLELGVATVYLWDLPHAFWAWKSHDRDLNFNEMVQHLDSPEYRTYLQSLNSSYNGGSIVDVAKVQKWYRKLSDTVHGKLPTFETLLPDRFDHSSQDWESHLELTNAIEVALLGLWTKRFPEASHQLIIAVPQLSRVSSE